MPCIRPLLRESRKDGRLSGSPPRELAPSWAWRSASSIGLALALLHGATPSALAAADFYAGKTLRIVVAAAPGAAYDFVGRALASSIGRHIPGNPSVVVENVQGAGSLVVMNSLYNKLPRDGTVMGLPLNGIVLEPKLKLLSRQGGVIAFDLGKMNFVGSPAQQPQILWVWHGTSFKTLDDLKGKKSFLGATSFGADNYILPVLSNSFLGTKMEVVTGYTAVNDVFLAGERGELDGGTVNYSSLAGKADWVLAKKARVLIQFGTERIADLPDVPTAVELAPDEGARTALRTYALKYKIAYPFIMPPAVPSERVEIIRAAFMDTMKDAQFIDDAKRLGFEVEPVSGDAIAKLVAEIDATPQEVIDRLSSALN